MKRVIIVGANEIEDTSFIKKEKERGSFLVACDGGYRCFMKENIIPDLFVGDYDTFKEKDLVTAKNIISLNTIKDDTDVFFAIKKLIKENYKEFHLYGCLGGKIEHTIANIQLLYFLINHNCKGYLYSSDNRTIVHMIKNSCIRLNPINALHFSVFSYNKLASGVSETGFKYEINDITLRNDTPLGVSNEFVGKEGSISVKDGILLLVLPIESVDL